MKRVILEKVETYQSDRIYDSIRNALNLIPFGFVSGQNVLIKPNVFSQNFSHQHSITHYSVVEAICKILKDYNCKIFIGESIAFYQKGLTKKAFKTSGMEYLSEKFGVIFCPFEEQKLIKKSVNLPFLKELYIPEILHSVDKVINVPKLKTHSALRFTGAIKNLYGCLPGGFKQIGHIITKDELELSDIFLEILSIVKPALNIMDAIVSLDGGPTALGKPVRTGKILVSTDAVALDIVACRMIGFEPKDIATLVRAKEKGMVDDFNDIEIIGDFEVKKFKNLIKGPFKERKITMFVTDTRVFPYVKKSKCNLCNKCIDFCPSSAIKLFSDGYPGVYYDKCIFCYYCFANCPCNAIKGKTTFKHKIINFFRFILRI